MDRIVALYWDNIDPRVVEAQRKVFAHFGLSIDQRERTGVGHGDFLDAYIDLKWEEIYKFEHTPHPIEFEMYYSV